MQTVGIIGVGLIGGSFGLALKKAGFGGRILGVSSAGTIAKARECGAIDEGLPLEEALPRADLLYLAQPIGQILDTLGRIDGLLKPGCLVTDAGSTKTHIVSRARGAIRNGQFLGGHPMAGKEKRGVEEADADLFVGRTYLLTPLDKAELETPEAQNFLEWLAAIGAVPLTLRPEEHDRIVSYTSHLPQLASTALAAMLAERLTGPEDYRVAGPGLLDATRLAMSSFEIWQDILRTNALEIDRALAAYIAWLTDMRAHVRTGDLLAEFEAAAEFAKKLRRER